MHPFMLQIATVLAIVLAAVTISCAAQKRMLHGISYDDDVYLDFKTPLTGKSDADGISASDAADANEAARESSDESEPNETISRIQDYGETMPASYFRNETTQNMAQARDAASKPNIERTVAGIFGRNLVVPDDAAYGLSSGNGAFEYKFKDGKIYVLLVSTGMITDLKLESGETVSGDIAIADQSFLIIDPVFSTENGKEILHLLFRANAPDMETTMVIPTSKRTYHFKIISTDKIGMHSISFKYDKKRTTGYDSHGGELAITGIRSLDYDYIVTGDVKIRPVAVFSDGNSTYIQFSKRFYANDSNPALYLENGSGINIINYTIRGNIYIADFLLDRDECFVLVSGKSKAYIEKEDYIKL